MKSLAVADRYGWTRFVAHQVYYSLIGREYEWELMPLALDQKVGALVWSPLGWGRLTGKIRRGQPMPEVSRLHKTADRRTAGSRRITSTKWSMRSTPSPPKPAKPYPADRPQLAAAPAHRLVHHPGRAQRGAVAPEPGRTRLEPHRRTDRETRRSQRRPGALSLLAPAPVPRAQSCSGVTAGTGTIPGPLALAHSDHC